MTDSQSDAIFDVYSTDERSDDARFVQAQLLIQPIVFWVCSQDRYIIKFHLRENSTRNRSEIAVSVTIKGVLSIGICLTTTANAGPWR